MSILTLAKRIVEEGRQTYPSVSKAMLYKEMTKRAEATRRADETPEMAFARIATTDTDGRTLFAAHKVARGEDHQPAQSADRGFLGPRPEERPIPPPNAAHDQLMRKAEALVDKVAKSGAGKRITLEAAYEKVLTDPANARSRRRRCGPRRSRARRPLTRMRTRTRTTAIRRRATRMTAATARTNRGTRSSAGSAPTRTRRRGPPRRPGRLASADARPRLRRGCRNFLPCAPRPAMTTRWATRYPAGA